MSSDHVSVDRTRLIALRNAKHWSKKRLAGEAGVDYSSYWRIESGRALNPRYETVQRLAQALGTTAEDLSVRGGSRAADETPAPSAGYGNVPVAEWLRDPDLRVMFYGITQDLTQEELESIKPILWAGYLRILAARGESDAGGDPAGSADPP